MVIDSQLFLTSHFYGLKDILNIFICSTFKALDHCISFSSTESPLPESLGLVLQHCRIMEQLLQKSGRSVSQDSFDFYKACLAVKLEVA